MNVASSARFALLSLPIALSLAFCGGKATVDPGSTSGAGGSTSTASMTSGSSTGATGGPNFAACSTPASCMLVGKGCCEGCGIPSLSELDAIGAGAVEAHRQAVCPEPMPCPQCEPQPNPHLFAYCDLAEGMCKGADLPVTKYAACTQPSDCFLRLGLGCCDCGAPEGTPWVAVSFANYAELQGLLCKEGEACANCAPQPPLDLAPDCVSGQCVVSVVGG